jgi:hypothetical protein
VTENGKTMEISFPNPASSVAEPLNIDNKEEGGKEEQVEHLEKSVPPSTRSLSNDKEVSTKAHSFVTILFETLHEPQASILRCLKEPSHAKLLKGLCTQDHKSRNHVPKKILRSK